MQYHGDISARSCSTEQVIAINSIPWCSTFLEGYPANFEHSLYWDSNCVTEVNILNNHDILQCNDMLFRYLCKICCSSPQHIHTQTLYYVLPITILASISCNLQSCTNCNVSYRNLQFKSGTECSGASSIVANDCTVNTWLLRQAGIIHVWGNASICYLFCQEP